MRSPFDRVMTMVEPEPTSGCWLFTGSLSPTGYGRITLPGGVKGYAHRVVYERVRGAIASDRELDHLCRVRCCVNPDHLESVTHQVNLLRGAGPSAIHAKKTHCPKGHAYSGHNLTHWGGQRCCRACVNGRRRRGSVEVTP
jgi:hypothetical protein